MTVTVSAGRPGFTGGAGSAARAWRAGLTATWHPLVHESRPARQQRPLGLIPRDERRVYSLLRDSAAVRYALSGTELLEVVGDDADVLCPVELS